MTEGDLPEPPDLPPALGEHCDMRRFAHVEIDPCMLYGEAFSGLSDAGFRALVLLVVAAWREVPAGSLPVAETTLAQYAGFGRDVVAWAKIRREVMERWTYCADGRLWFAPMMGAVEDAAGRLKTVRMQESDRKARGRMLARLREAGVVMPDAEVAQHLPDALAAWRARGGDRMRGQRRDELVIAIASALGLLPRAGGDLGPQFGAGLRPIGAATRFSKKATGPG